MKHISAKLFFTVMWNGICQAFAWFFGLFGYKREGRFAKYVWRIFSASAAVVMVAIAASTIYDTYDDLANRQNDRSEAEEYGLYVSRNITFVPNYKGHGGCLFDKSKNDFFLKGIDWIARPLGDDSLVCFKKGDLRGYFNAKDGRVVIKPQYRHAWVFSDGVAAIEEDGFIKFIDSSGKVVLDNGMKYDANAEGYVFHGGYLIVSSADKRKHGLIDHKGTVVLPVEYDEISIASSLQYWLARKDNLTTVFDHNLTALLPPTEGFVSFDYDHFLITMSDHSVSMYSYDGSLMNAFCLYDVYRLEYETDELDPASMDSDSGTFQGIPDNVYKKSTALLRSYTAGDGYRGLITPEGKIVTKPLYKEIKALGPNTYLCSLTDDEKVIVNGQGQVVK